MAFAKPTSASKKKGNAKSRRSNTSLSVRCVAVKILQQLNNESGSLTTLLPEWEQQISIADRALLRELCYGVARWSPRLLALANLLMTKPIRRKDADVLMLIQLGLYQLDHMRVPEHAVLNLTVDVTGELGKSWARGLVNAVLRSYLRDRDKLVDQLDKFAKLACPAWLGSQLASDWPLHWQAHLQGSNERPPMSLRINCRRRDVQTYLSELEAAGIEANTSTVCESAVVLRSATGVEDLPGFAEGHVSVQDAAAQLATHILAPVAGERVLDACAAPGGKTGHLLEFSEEIDVVAVDSVARRLDRVADNLERLSLMENVRLHCADAADLDSWWDGTLFDAVLLDAPCSGTGVIRRHPDIKLLRRAEDIQQLADQQRKLLQSLWRVLRPGGRMLYATCSVLKTENEAQISAFLDITADASVMELPMLAHSVSTANGRQIFRGSHDGDGFFYSLLRRSGEHSTV